MSCNLDARRLIDGLNTLDNRMQTAVLMYSETAASNLEEYMKANKKWTDRTGHAKQRLTGRAYRVNCGVRIELAHGVDYGIWLELANGKNYAIIEPTIRLKSQEVLKGFEGLLGRMRS